MKVAIKRAEKRSALQPTSLDLGANVKRRRVTESDTGRSQQGLRGVSSRGGVVGGSALDAIMAQEEAQKQRELAREYALEQEQAAAAAAEAARKKQNKPKRKSYWLVPGIVVKVGVPRPGSSVCTRGLLMMCRCEHVSASTRPQAVGVSTRRRAS